MTETIDDTRLHRYFDGDLSPEESAEVRRRIEADPGLRAKLDGLREVRSLVRAQSADELRAAPLDSDALWARIEAGIEGAAPGEERVEGAAERARRSGLRAIEGGRAAERAPAPVHAGSPEQRRRRIAGIVVGALAIAAAVLLIVVRPGEPGPDDGPVAEGDPTVAPAPGPVEPGSLAPTAAEEVARTEVLEVDFGEGSGAIFSVEGDDGERYAVVWLADSEPKETSVE